MAVIINEIEHTAPAPQDRAGGGGMSGGAGSAGQSAGAAASVVQILAALRRDASRRARLWAD